MSETQTARSRRRAGGRPPLRLDADHGALVAARRGPRDRRDARRARLGRRRRGLPRHDAALPRAAVHDLGRRPDPEPRHEPEDREPDHPLRGGAAPGGGRERPHRRPAARQRLVAGDRHGGPGARTSRRSSRSRSTRPPAGKAEKAADSLADSVVGVVSTYVDQKIELLNKQIVASKTELEDDQRARLERRQAAAGDHRRQDASRRPTS